MVGRKNGAASGFCTATLGLFRSRIVSRCNKPIHCDLGKSAMVAKPGAAGAGVGALAAVCAIGPSFVTSSLCFALSPCSSFAHSTGFGADPRTISSASADSACSRGRRTVTVGGPSPDASASAEFSSAEFSAAPASVVSASFAEPVALGAYTAALAQRYTPLLPSCVVASMSIAGESDMPVTTFPLSKPPKRTVCNKRAAGTSQTRTQPSADDASTHRPSLENSKHVATVFCKTE